MKDQIKIYILFFLMTKISLYKSQKYDFTTYCEVIETQLKGEHKNQARQIQIWYNLKDNSYIAYQYPKENLMLYDYNKNIKSVISIFEKDKVLTLISKGVMNSNPDEIVISNVAVKDLGNDTFLLKTFRTQKSRNSNLEIIFELEKSNYPLVQIDFLDMSKNIHDKIYKALIAFLPSENYQIKIIKYNYKNGVVMYKDFSKCQNTDLILQFP